MAEQSIAQLFLLGQQRAQQRKEFLHDQKVKQLQLQSLIEDRAIERERTSPEYAQTLSALLNADISDEDYAKGLQKLKPADIPSVAKAHAENLDRKFERLQRVMSGEQVYQAVKAVDPNAKPEEFTQPLPREVVPSIVSGRGADIRQGERLDLQERKFQAQQETTAFNNKLKEKRLEFDQQRLAIYKNLGEKQAQIYDQRLADMRRKFMSGDVKPKDLFDWVAFRMVGTGQALNPEQARIAQEVSTSAWNAYGMGSYDTAFEAVEEEMDVFGVKQGGVTKEGEKLIENPPENRGSNIAVVPVQDIDAQIQAAADKFASIDALPKNEKGKIADKKILLDAGIAVTPDTLDRLKAILNAKFAGAK